MRLSQKVNAGGSGSSAGEGSSSSNLVPIQVQGGKQGSETPREMTDRLQAILESDSVTKKISSAQNLLVLIAN